MANAKKKDRARAEANQILNQTVNKMSVGAFSSARHDYKQCVRLARIHKDPYLTTRTYHQMGNACYELKMMYRALYWHKRSLRHACSSHDREMLISSSQWIGNIHFFKKKILRSIHYYQNAIAFAKESNCPPLLEEKKKKGISEGSYGLARCYNTIFQFQAAQEFIEKAIEIDEGLNDKTGLLDDYMVYIITLISLKNLSKARIVIENAKNLIEKTSLYAYNAKISHLTQLVEECDSRGWKK